MPVTYGNALYNCAVVFAQGRIHGVVPKTYIPNYSEFYEARCFMSGEEIGLATIRMCGQDTDFGRNMLFNIGGVKFGVEICEDMWVPAAPSLHQAVDGAQILFNLSASPEVLGKHNYLLTLVKSQSARTQSAYIYCSAGYGESSTDLVFGGNGLIVESGRMLRRTERFSTEEQLIVADIDTEKLLNSRRRTTTFAPHRPAERIIVEIPLPETPRTSPSTGSSIPILSCRKRPKRWTNRVVKSSTFRRWGWPSACSIPIAKRSSSGFPAAWTPHWPY